MSSGTYTFKWTKPAEEVYVTGTFDNWTKSQQLLKTADGTHLATVTIPHEKVTYKFVVDGNWVTDPDQRVEKDASGNDNNVILPEDISSTSEEPSISAPVLPGTNNDTTVSPFLSSAGPASTTAVLAGAVPLEPKRDLEAEEAARTANISSVASEATTTALAAEVPLEEKTKEEPIVPEATKEETVGVHPLPASENATNPITLAPGEEVPPTTQNVNDNVKLDEESYNKPDASNLGVGATAAAAFAAVTGFASSAYGSVTGTGTKTETPAGEAKEVDAPQTSIVDKVKNLIPESVLPISVPGLSSITPDHTKSTTNTVPDVVTESQFKADTEPEASAVPAVVEEKKAVEDELLEKTKLAEAIPMGESFGERADVPDVVRESQGQAEAPLEASASPIAVDAKKAIEAQLMSEVKVAEPISETPLTKPSEPEAVPAVVAASLEKAGETSEAAENPSAVQGKSAVEAAITSGETKVDTLEPPKPEESSTTEEGKTSTVAEKATEKAEKAVDATAATLGASSSSAKPSDTKSVETTGSTSTPGTPSTADKKKKKRMSSFFGKIKEKLK